MRKNPMLNNERMLNDAIFMFSVRRARGEGKERGGGEREESEYEFQGVEQDWWLCCLEISLPKRLTGMGLRFASFVFHFRSPHRSTPHNTLSMTYELIVHIRLMSQTISTVKVQIEATRESREWLGRKVTMFVVLDDWQKKKAAEKWANANLRPSTKAKVNKKFIIFTLTIAVQGQFTLKFIQNENVTVKSETQRKKKWSSSFFRCGARSGNWVRAEATSCFFVWLVVWCGGCLCNAQTSLKVAHATSTLFSLALLTINSIVVG